MRPLDVLLPFQFKLDRRADRDGQTVRHSFREHDFAAARLPLEARSRVHDVSDCGEVIHGPLTDVADERLPDVETDPHLYERPVHGLVPTARSNSMAWSTIRIGTCSRVMRR